MSEKAVIAIIIWKVWLDYHWKLCHVRKFGFTRCQQLLKPTSKFIFDSPSLERKERKKIDPLFIWGPWILVKRRPRCSFKTPDSLFRWDPLFIWDPHSLFKWEPLLIWDPSILVQLRPLVLFRPVNPFWVKTPCSFETPDSLFSWDPLCIWDHWLLV